MIKLEKTDKFMEVINSIKYDVGNIIHWNYGDDDAFLMGMRRDLDIMVFKLQWKIFEHIRPNGDIDVCLDKNIQDKDLLSTYKSIMHSDIPTWKEVKNELLEEITNLAETRNYVRWYKTKFAMTLSNVLDVDDFRNNPNHNIVKRIEKISPDVGTRLYLINRIDTILVCLNGWIREFAALMDEWWSGAPEISNQNIELVISNSKQDQSPFDETSSTLTIIKTGEIEPITIFKNKDRITDFETKILRALLEYNYIDSQNKWIYKRNGKLCFIPLRDLVGWMIKEDYFKHTQSSFYANLKKYLGNKFNVDFGENLQKSRIDKSNTDTWCSLNI